MMTEISPREVLDRLFRRWPLIALGVLLGGLLGLLASRLLTPVYEAHAGIYINLDSTLWAQQNHPGDPVEIAISNSMAPITDLFYSDETVAALLTAAQAEDLPLDRDAFFTDFSIQRVNMTWQMTVRARDPRAAARLADLWVQTGLALDDAAQVHALSAYVLTLERDALAACFEANSLAAGNTCAGTALVSLTDLEPLLGELAAQVAAERELSLGLDPALWIVPGDPAAVPAAPVRFQRTWLILAGAMIGLIVGSVLSQGAFPKWKSNVRTR